MIKYLTLIIVFSITTSCFAQKSKSYSQKLKYASEFNFINDSESGEAFYISLKPITNREYIVYLLWLQDIYADYPMVVSNAIPRQNNIVWYDSAYVEADSYLNNLLKGMDPSDKEYVFNSLYLDYPVIGLSWQQAMDFSKWLSDRYNEYILITEKFYKLDLYQRNDECFNTESYLAGQYMGMINNPKKEINWKDNKLISSFRLPTNNELIEAKEMISNEMKPYKMFSFLKSWYSETVNEDTVILSFGEPSERNFVRLTPTKLNIDKTFKELTLDLNSENINKDVLDIYKDYGLLKIDYTIESQQRKDSLGLMPYSIIGKTSKNEILAVKRRSSILPNELYLSENKIFRVVLNSIIN